MKKCLTGGGGGYIYSYIKVHTSIITFKHALGSKSVCG